MTNPNLNFSFSSHCMKNRIEDFINKCINRGWIVNKLDVENNIEIYNKSDKVIRVE